jgi:outer membrane immunogenic protein
LRNRHTSDNFKSAIFGDSWIDIESRAYWEIPWAGKFPMKKLLIASIVLIAVGGIANAADLAPRTYTKAPPMVAETYNWSGFYLGGNVGGQWGDADPRTSTVYSLIGYFDVTSVPPIAAAGAQKFHDSNVTGGFTAGYNWQANNQILFGVEGDINWFGFRGGATSGAVYPCCGPTAFTINSSVSADWLATIRARLGLIATPNLLLYATGGAAIADVKANWAFTDTFATAAESASLSDTRVGWTVGAGGEYRVGGGWSLKAEYLYVDLGSVSATSTNLTAYTPALAFPSNVFSHSVSLKSNIARIGLNYHFH